MDKQHGSRLLLSWQDTEVAMGVDDTFVLGCTSDAHLPVQAAYASRIHAHISREKQYFVLTDCSTNGTYVQSEDLKVTHVHRDSVRLWGNGWLSLGESLSNDNAVRFRHDV